MAKSIVNLTQHTATPEQTVAGVVDLPPEIRQQLVKLLTIDELPTLDDLHMRALEVVSLVRPTVEAIGDAERRVPRVMVGGAPFFMPVLVAVLEETFLTECLYAFSKRVSVEDPVTGVKTSTFKHEGFVPHFSE